MSWSNNVVGRMATITSRKRPKGWGDGAAGGGEEGLIGHLVDLSAACMIGLGHRDVRTTMPYLHVMNRGALGVKSPMDRL